MKFILLVILLNGDYYGGSFNSVEQCRKELLKLETERVLAFCEPQAPGERNDRQPVKRKA